MLNEREMDILSILWGTDEAMTAMDIVNAKKGLTQSTVTAVIRKMLNAGWVDAVGVTHSGKVLSRTYRPTEASINAILNHFKEFYQSASNIFTPSEMCINILKMSEDKDKTKQEIAKLKKIIREYQKKENDE